MFPKHKMPHNKPTPRLSQRIAEEAQLLAEEKWIIEALKKIKAQRNGLQIERLHLESMRVKILASMSKDQAEASSSAQTTSAGTSGMPAVTMQQTDPLESFRLTNLDALDDDELCNTEELNLSVTNSVFNQGSYNQMCDEEEDDEDMDNCVLDIDLLMSGK